MPGKSKAFCSYKLMPHAIPVLDTLNITGV